MFMVVIKLLQKGMFIACNIGLFKVGDVNLLFQKPLLTKYQRDFQRRESKNGI